MPCTSIPSATTQQDWVKCTPSIIIASRFRVLKSALSSSASAVSVWATNYCDTADLLVAVATSLACCPTGARPFW